MIPELLFFDGICNKLSLIVISHRPDKPDVFTFMVVCPQLLRNLPLVVADNLVGNLQDILGASVILLEFDYFNLIIIFSKKQDILDGCTPKGIDGLCIITHHAYIFMCRSQEFNNLVLSRIGILVLIDHDMAEFVLVFV